MFRRLNDSLPGLVLGIFIYGILAQVLILLLPVPKLSCTIGLWYGILIAVGMAINLASVIYDSVMLGDEKSARARAIIKSVLRYVVVCILFFLIGLFQFGNLYTALIGVMGLKISAYLQPLMGAVSRKLFGENSWYPADDPDSWYPEEELKTPDDEKGFNE